MKKQKNKKTGNRWKRWKHFVLCKNRITQTYEVILLTLEEEFLKVRAVEKAEYYNKCDSGKYDYDTSDMIFAMEEIGL